MTKNQVIIFTIIVILIALLNFLYTDPLGIKIGYKINGGEISTEADIKPEELVRQYNEYITTYNLYKDSSNPTAQNWANTAKQKANEIATKYNTLMNELILDFII